MAERADVPDKIVNEALQYAEFHGMGINRRQMKKLLDFITPEILLWDQQGPTVFAKGYKGGIKRPAAAKGPRSGRNEPKLPTGVKHVVPCCKDGKCGCRCHS